MASIHARVAVRERVDVTDVTDRRAVAATLGAFPDRVAAAAREAARRPVTAGEWSPEQVIRHLVAVEHEVHQARLRDLATTSDPRWTWTEPGPWTGASELDLDGVVARFVEARATTVATLESLDDAAWARTGTHETFGALDVAALMRTAIDHDEEHLRGLRS